MTNPALLVPHLFSNVACKNYDDQLPESSTLDDAVWMRAGSNRLKQGARAETTGQCIPRGWSGPNCITYPTQNRNLGQVALGEDPPSGPTPANYPLTRWTQAQYLDSSEAGTTNGPISRSPSLEGEYLYTFFATTTPTNCVIQNVTHPVQTKRLYVSACKPEWYFDQQRTRLRLPETVPIIITVPYDMTLAFDSMQSAAGVLSAQLGRDVSVRFESIGNVPEPCVGGGCVNLDDTFTAVPGDQSCADMKHGTFGPSGVLNGPSTIRVLANAWQSTDADRLAAVFAHELLHAFGLDNRDASGCTTGNTLMHGIAGGCYSSDPLPEGQLAGPSSTDVASVKDGSYGLGVRKLCGW